jgi:hypothetical protein
MLPGVVTVRSVLEEFPLAGEEGASTSSSELLFFAPVLMDKSNSLSTVPTTDPFVTLGDPGLFGPSEMLVRTGFLGEEELVDP